MCICFRWKLGKKKRDSHIPRLAAYGTQQCPYPSTGLLTAGRNNVTWPNRNQLYLFLQETPRNYHNDRYPAEIIKPFPPTWSTYLCTGSSIPSWTLWTMTLAPEVATQHARRQPPKSCCTPPSAGSKTRLPLPSTPVSRCVGVIQYPTTTCTVPHLLLSHFWHQEVAGGDSEFPRWREGRCLQTERELAASYVLRSCLCLGASIARTVLDTTYLG